MVNPQMKTQTFEGIDLFAGAGGVTTGIEQAEYAGRPVARVRVAINHDPIALRSHGRNHPKVLHFTEDITTFDVRKLPKLTPNAISYIWASLECTNFSNAKGGEPRDADSRTLANSLFAYIEQVNPDYILIENVREFMAWGPLDEKGKPLSRKNGIDYIRWVQQVCDYGYNYDWRLLNAADFGAHTSRVRLFIIFARKGLPIRFPKPTHSKKPNGLKAWKPVREVLDLVDEGESIFSRKKPLVERTLKRIYAGLERYVATDHAWIVKYYNNKSRGGVDNGASINMPAPTITTIHGIYLAQVNFLQNYNGNVKSGSSSIEDPARTVTTKDRLCKVTALKWIDKQYNSDHNHQSLEVPAGTVTTNPKLAIVTAESFLMPTNFTNAPHDLNRPCGALTANRKWHYLVNPQFSTPAASIEKPSFTLIARMDKKPPYLVTTEAGQLAIEITPEDSPTMRKIKQFMAAHGIIDIKMRMLKIRELKKITGLPEDYVLLGNKGDQKKFIGNAVPPVIPRRIFETLFREINGLPEEGEQTEGLPLFKCAE